jgi:hypothetical protein
MWTWYSDILDLAPTRPLWWDEQAVPRFCQFAPDKVSNFYAREAALLLVRCQFGPAHCFVVAVSVPQQEGTTLADEIRAGTIHYGDPPRIAECGDGDANSIAIRVLQYWRYICEPRPARWVRDRSLEIVLDPTEEQHPPRSMTWGDYDAR